MCPMTCKVRAFLPMRQEFSFFFHIREICAKLCERSIKHHNTVLILHTIVLIFASYWRFPYMWQASHDTYNFL